MPQEGSTSEPTGTPSGIASQDAQHAVQGTLDVSSDKPSNKRKRSDGPQPRRKRGPVKRNLILDGLKFLPCPNFPELSEEKLIENARINLREHAKRRSALFFIELSPTSSTRGAGCQFVNCTDKISEDDYRFAVHPGMDNMYGGPDFYHINCFEKMVDFSEIEVLKRVTPLTRINYAARKIKSSAVVDGKYLLDGGAERLLLQWIESVHCLIAERDGVEQEPIDTELLELLTKAGSASFTPKQPQGITSSEYLKLIGALAPIESDGAEDEDEWNLFDEFEQSLDDLDDLKGVNSMSHLLQHWRANRILATYEEERLTDECKQLRNQMGEKSVKAIRRLSFIPMPDLQSRFSFAFLDFPPAEN